MTDLDKRLNNIEKKLDGMIRVHQVTGNGDNRLPEDEIDFRELWDILWKGKWIIIVVTLLFSICSIVYALSLPNIYKSEVLLAPTGANTATNIGGLGGLASLAGVSIGSGDDKVQLAVEMLVSRSLIREVMETLELKPKIMAVLKWKQKENELIYNSEFYDSENKRWVREVEFPLTPDPSFEEFYEVFRSNLKVGVDKKSGFVSISYEHQSPEVARSVVASMVDTVNENMRQRDVEKAAESIKYLQKQLAETSLAEMKTSLFELMEEQIKTKMLASVRKQYVLQEVDPPFLPEKRSSPSRSIICVIFFLVGGVLSVCIVFLKAIIKRN